jgi:hypothetical protein
VLKDLRRRGLVTARLENGAGHLSRLTYTITPKGRRALATWLNRAPRRPEFVRDEIFIRLGPFGSLMRASPNWSVRGSMERISSSDERRRSLAEQACIEPPNSSCSMRWPFMSGRTSDGSNGAACSYGGASSRVSDESPMTTPIARHRDMRSRSDARTGWRQVWRLAPSLPESHPLRWGSLAAPSRGGPSLTKADIYCCRGVE